MSTKRDYAVGSGNVFADSRVPHPDEALAKAELAHKITQLIERRRLSGFSLDRLLRFLVLLGHDVNIVVKKRSRPGGPARLLVA
jgi:predicted XRE-type DNA-binding protein